MRGINANGTVIRQARQALGWTQEKFASACDCSTRTVRSAEQGKSLDINTLRLLAGVLDLSVADVSVSPCDNLSTCERNMEIVRQWRAAFFDRDVERILSFHHPDSVLILPGTEDLPHGGNCAGLEQLRAYYAGVFSMSRFEIMHDERIDAFENLVFHRATVTARILPTDKTFRTTHVNQFQFEDELIIHRETVADYSKLREAI
jgi:transcriptional regulator with XRE-family HTH domain